MSSRPGPGIHESLQPRGSGAAPRAQVRRRASIALNAPPQPDCIDPTLEDERPPVSSVPADVARLPPKGRPQLFYSTAPSHGIELPIHPFPYQPTGNLPAPPRPGSVHLRDASQQRRIVPGGTGVKDPPSLHPPEAAPAPVQFPGGKAADLYPWTGNNPEDMLTETLVKGGISNKPQIMNETNIARLSLWSNLKNKSGLTTLSSLLVAVFEKRQQGGRLQAPNTFKPPPRLTLRDSTREQWLHDLANPVMGLRRLSRTIPHGLTGKVLLEQCLNKNIPLPRALWLAKCVGINELRAHKRKGQAGTLTWVRGWTSSVEQFLDGVVSTIGQKDWKQRVTYALQLATCLYKEHLLDEDHFIDWILHGLDTCPSERVFIWLMVISIPQYWADITSNRRRGKCLAESLLNYTEKLHALEDINPFLAAVQYLEQTILKLLATRPACLLLPTTWNRHGPLLHKLAAKRNHPQITQAVQKIERRNIRLLGKVEKASSRHKTPTARIFHLLDSVNYISPIRIDDMAADCMAELPNAAQLVATVLQWASSCYRQGPHRMYLAIRLLRRWNHRGADVYDGIVAYLQGMAWHGPCDLRIIFRIVAELVRSKTFHVGRYLQWLIATGSLESDADLSSSDAWPIRLVIEIPLTGLTDQVLNLRSTLLRGTSSSTDLEAQTLTHVKRSIAQEMPTLFNIPHTDRSPAKIDLDKLSSTIKLEIGIWLRQHVAQYAEVNEHVPTKDLSIEETAAVSLLNSNEFDLVRDYLERFNDLAILADVIGVASSSLDATVLASAADTLNYHMQSFRAMGALDPLFGKIAQRYTAIRTIRFPERDFVLSFLGLARTVQADSNLLQLLAYDLNRLEQKSSIAACSPASDNMGEVMQHSMTYSADEIERILSSGNSMDQQMMARMLRKIVYNLQEHVQKGGQDFTNYPVWFYRLRSFDEPTFDMVFADWMDTCFTTCNINDLIISLPHLVASGCVILRKFSDALQAFIKTSLKSPSEGAFRTALDGLGQIISLPDPVLHCSRQDAYRFRLEQRMLCREANGQLVACLCGMIELGSLASPSISQTQLNAFLSTEPALETVLHAIVKDSGSLCRLSQGQTGKGSIAPFLKIMLQNMLDPDGQFGLSKQDTRQQILLIFKMANQLSLPICQALIELFLTSSESATNESDNSVFDALLAAVEAAFDEKWASAFELLASLDTSLTNQLRQHAERAIIAASSFLSLPASMRTEPDIEPTSANMAQKYLSIIDLTSAHKESPAEQPVSLTDLIDRFRGINQALRTGAGLTNAPSQTALSAPDAYTWLSALIRLAVAHGATLLRNASHVNQAGIMIMLKVLFGHSCFEMYPWITEHIFDGAVVISDHISDDSRQALAYLDIMKTPDDPRSRFILGLNAPIDGWLVLSRPTNTHTLPASSQPPTPTALQNPAPPSNSPQLSASVPGTPQQRYFNQQQQRQHQMQGQQAQSAQQMRAYSPHIQNLPHNKMLPAQLQRTPSGVAPSPMQQLQHMQQMQGLAQQRATQPSPMYMQGQRPTPAVGQSAAASNPAAPGKLQIKPEREMRQVPFVQPRWEIIAESAGNPNANETAISLTLFGARKV